MARSSAIRPLALCLWVMVLTIPACNRSSAAAEEPESLRVFKTFQEAMFQQDRKAVRRLLTMESRRFASKLPLAQLRNKKRLVILGARQSGHEHRVRVQDPNNGNRESCYVLVREHGEMRVDLVATTALNHVVHHRPGRRVLQKQMTPKEMERVRAMSQQHRMLQRENEKIPAVPRKPIR